MKSSAVACVILALSCGLFAQTAPPGRVWFPLIIEDSRHQPAIGLTRDSLAISDETGPLADFMLVSTANLPLRLGLLVDISGSQSRYDLERVLAAARDFARTAVRSPEDRVFFMEFNAIPKATGWLTAGEAASIPTQVTAGGGTALYDAIFSACKQRMGDADWSRLTRRILVVIGDGDDNSSHVTNNGAVAEAVSTGTVIFTLARQDSFTSGPGRGDKIMNDLAKLSGGRYFYVAGEKDVTKSLAKLFDLISAMYFASYVPVAGGPKSREIEVRSASKEKLEISYPKKTPQEQ